MRTLPTMSPRSIFERLNVFAGFGGFILKSNVVAVTTTCLTNRKRAEFTLHSCREFVNITVFVALCQHLWECNLVPTAELRPDSEDPRPMEIGRLLVATGLVGVLENVSNHVINRSHRGPVKTPGPRPWNRSPRSFQVLSALLHEHASILTRCTAKEVILGLTGYSTSAKPTVGTKAGPRSFE